jgi:poly(hydroxyalkanoate) granule-associated protein
MAQKKSSRSRYSASAANDAGRAVSDSAHKIWLAGLGAFERAKSEGPRMFETLVEQGRSLGGKARDAAEEALKNVRQSAAAGDLSRQVRDLAENVRALMAQQSARGKAAGGAKKRSAASKRRGAAKAGAAKRKVKRAVSPVKRNAKRTRSKARKS